MIDDSPRTTALTKSEADALVALLFPRSSTSLFGPVVDLCRSPAATTPVAKPLFDQTRVPRVVAVQPVVPVLPGARPSAPTISKPIFERPSGPRQAVGERGPSDARRTAPRLTVAMGEAVPVGFVPAGAPAPGFPNRRWFLALMLVALGGVVAALFTLGGGGRQIVADGERSTASDIATLGATTTRPTSTVTTITAPTSTVTTTTTPTTIAPATTVTAAPSTVAAAPVAPPTTARRSTTTTRRTTSATGAPTTSATTTVGQTVPQTTVTLEPPIWSVTSAPTSAPPSSTPATTATPTTATPTTATPTTSPTVTTPPTSAATSAVQQ